VDLSDMDEVVAIYSLPFHNILGSTIRDVKATLYLCDENRSVAIAAPSIRKIGAGEDVTFFFPVPVKEPFGKKWRNTLLASAPYERSLAFRHAALIYLTIDGLELEIWPQKTYVLASYISKPKTEDDVGEGFIIQDYVQTHESIEKYFTLPRSNVLPPPPPIEDEWPTPEVKKNIFI